MDKPDYFQFFGLEPRLTLDLGDLEQRFYLLSRELHPDRFQRATPAERERALEASALLNDAYRTLRNPLSRAEYMLKRQGIEAGGSKQVPPALLGQIFELNEALEELRSGDSSIRPRVERAQVDFRALLGEADAQIEDLFRKYDAGDAAALGEIRSVLGRRRYISNLLAEIDRGLIS
jgi:molecular chaperone HscB